MKGVIECLKIVTETKSRRIAKFAFDYATKHDRKKVTAVHKANIMKLGDGLFLRCCQEVSTLYPNIKFEHMIVDNTCMQVGFKSLRELLPQALPIRNAMKRNRNVRAGCQTRFPADLQR